MNEANSNIPDVIDTPEGPAVTWYEDGPTARPDDGSDPVEVEDAYREGFFKGAEEAYTWEEPDREAVERAFDRRREAKQRASVRRPEDPPHVWLYRVGHAVEAAKLRGYAQALATTVDGWDRLERRGVRRDFIADELVPYWHSEVEEWCYSGPSPDRTYLPPFVDETPLAEIAGPGHRPGVPLSPADQIRAYPPWRSVRELMEMYTDLRRPVIHGLMREGETMNVIAPSKSFKSWLVASLAVCVVSGRPWFGRYETVKGPVLIIDNELHAETSGFRIPKVADALGVSMADYADNFKVWNMRGQLKDLFELADMMEGIKRGQFRMIVLDAWYRFMPSDSSENDNAMVAHLYNRLDQVAAKIDCCFAIVHHSSKGGQGAKSVTDVGAGAGAQSRAADAHLVMREHEEEKCVVLDAAVRSWPPIEPVGLRWTFPVWEVDETIDPAELKQAGRRRSRREKKPETAKPKPEPWTPERFVAQFMGKRPKTKGEILMDVETAEGLTKANAKTLLSSAERAGMVHRWQKDHTSPVLFSTQPPPEGYLSAPTGSAKVVRSERSS